MTKACPFHIDSATSKRLSPQLLALVHHTVKHDLAKLDVEYRGLMRMARNLTWVEQQQSTGVFELRWAETIVCHMQYGNLPLMLQPCLGNVGPTGFWNGTSEDDGNEDALPTLGKQRWKNIVPGKALTAGLWRLLRMVIGCGWNTILYSSRNTIDDRGKSCVCLACALEGLPPGQQALATLSGDEAGCSAGVGFIVAPHCRCCVVSFCSESCRQTSLTRSVW